MFASPGAGSPVPRIPETFSFNNGEAVVLAVKAWTLQALLPGHLMEERGALWRVWPTARPTPPKVRVFGDFLARRLAEVS